MTYMQLLIYLAFLIPIHVLYFAKVDRDVAYVAIVVHICCKRPFSLFQLFYVNIAYILFGYCKCCSG
jgi:hypothetical protein